MIAKKTRLLCVGLGATLLAASAQAQPVTEPDAGAGAPDQLTLPKDRLVLDAFVEINLSTDAVFKPFGISPDLWYGATPDLTVGLIHSSVARTGVIGGVGDSLCLSGSGNLCPDLYPGFGLDARYKLNFKTGPVAWAADGGLLFNHISDPFLFALKLGAIGRWHQSPQITLEFQPNLALEITNRSSSVTTGGITVTTTVPDVLTLPATVLYAVNPTTSVSAQLAFVIPFENTGDTYFIPLSIGGHYRVNESLTATAAFSLTRLIGGGPGTGIDGRSLTLGGTYAF